MLPFLWTSRMSAALAGNHEASPRVPTQTHLSHPKLRTAPHFAIFAAPKWVVFCLNVPVTDTSLRALLKLIFSCSLCEDREVKAKPETLPGFELPLQYFARTHPASRNPRIVWLGTGSFTALKFLGNFHWNSSCSNKSFLLSFIPMRKRLRCVRLA